MSDELLPQAGGDEPTDEQASSGNDEIAKLRREAANWRTKFRDLEGKWKTAEPVLTEYQKAQEAQKSEAQKLAERLAEAERKAADSDSMAQRAMREAKLVRLATKAGVDPDVAGLLDLSKLDLDDEKATLETLGKLAAARQTANGASNPARNGAQRETDEELRKFYFDGGRSKPTIFGG